MHSHSIDDFRHSHVFLGAGHERNERRTWTVIAICTAMMIAEIIDRKSTRLNSSHSSMSYAVFCLKKKIAKGKKRSGARPGRPQPLRGSKGKRKGARLLYVGGQHF